MIACVRSGWCMALLILMFCSVATAQNSAPLFKLIPSVQSGINFKNQLFESDTLNILNQANIYNGGGVGVGDFNRDGLMDLYLAGNMVSNKLYLNKGSLLFNDVTEAAGVNGLGRWCTGVSVVDINADGWPDIYLAASFMSNLLLRTNLLYINHGLNSQGIPQFTEEASSYGLADDGYSTQGYFFDYDKDGDLDMYLVTNEIYDKKTPIRFRAKLTDGSANNTDRLYRNNGNNTFTNVSKQAGITIEGWGHAACITDFNKDGWPDIYVANDFVSNDLCYINNKNGTFTNQANDYFKHSGWNAMGTDAVDINNDGNVDLISLEMLPEDNLRKKRMLSGNEYYNYTNAGLFGYQHQYVRNVLQLNNGMKPEGKPIFNDIGFMAGVYQTDWSWCPLVADFDNDGYRDLIITNGLPRDVTDLDYIDYNNGQRGNTGNYSLAMTDSLPIVKLPNYAYKNINGLTFTNITKAWGFDTLTFSNGAAYADLDNDGDLDVIINNINGVAFLYENTLRSSGAGDHFLTIKLEGDEKNPGGIGAHLTAFYNKGKIWYYEQQPMRGYLSTDDARAHLGTGTTSNIDTLVVTWPDGKIQRLLNIQTDKEITVRYKDAKEKAVLAAEPMANALLTDVANKYGIHYKPKENDFVDYNIQRTLPHKLSQYGPGIAVGDIDKNGYDDFYVGGSSGNPGVFFMQDATGKFALDSSRFLQKDDRLFEDMGALLFDADGDGDLDLYLVSGSYEIPPNHPIANDRLYINNGKGRFSKSTGGLPADLTNGSCVRAADIDGDGDLDLFVGVRVIPFLYGLPGNGYILINDGAGNFSDATATVAPQLQKVGMITKSRWVDLNQDDHIDLVIVGDWMPVMIFIQEQGKLIDRTKEFGLEKTNGWYHSLEIADFNNDGKLDLAVGNHGLNSRFKATKEEPVSMHLNDFDHNGTIEQIISRFDQGISYPLVLRNDLVAQIPSLKKKYLHFSDYRLKTMADIFSPEQLKESMVLNAYSFETTVFINKGNSFEKKSLPMQAQFSPVYSILVEDFNHDGNLDLLMGGNLYRAKPETGIYDGSYGLLLTGDGTGRFAAETSTRSGVSLKGEIRSLTSIHFKKRNVVLVGKSNDQLEVLSY